MQDVPTTAHVYEPIGITKGHNKMGTETSQGLSYTVSLEHADYSTSKFHKYGPISQEQRVYSLVEDLSGACSGGPVHVNDGLNDSRNDGRNDSSSAGINVSPNDGSNDGPNALNNSDSCPLKDGRNKTEPVYHTIEETYNETTEEPIDEHASDERPTDGPVYSTLEGR